MRIAHFQDDGKGHAGSDLRRQTAANLDPPQHPFREEPRDDDDAQQKGKDKIKEIMARIDRNQTDTQGQSGEDPSLPGKMETAAGVEIVTEGLRERAHRGTVTSSRRARRISSDRCEVAGPLSTPLRSRRWVSTGTVSALMGRGRA